MACTLFLQSPQKLKEYLQVFTEGIQFFKHKQEEKNLEVRKKGLKKAVDRRCSNKQHWGQ